MTCPSWYILVACIRTGIQTGSSCHQSQCPFHAASEDWDPEQVINKMKSENILKAWDGLKKPKDTIPSFVHLEQYILLNGTMDGSLRPWSSRMAIHQDGTFSDFEP